MLPQLETKAPLGNNLNDLRTVYNAGVVNVLDFKTRLSALWPHLNERQRRLAAAVEARALGYGGVSLGCLR